MLRINTPRTRATSVAKRLRLTTNVLYESDKLKISARDFLVAMFCLERKRPRVMMSMIGMRSLRPLVSSNDLRLSFGHFVIQSRSPYYLVKNRSQSVLNFRYLPLLIRTFSHSQECENVLRKVPKVLPYGVREWTTARPRYFLSNRQVPH